MNSLACPSWKKARVSDTARVFWLIVASPTQAGQPWLGGWAGPPVGSSARFHRATVLAQSRSEEITTSEVGVGEGPPGEHSSTISSSRGSAWRNAVITLGA